MSEARAYLSAEQLAAATPWSVEAIRRMVRRGILRRGVHYFQPRGRGTQLIFKWSTIVALIEADPAVEADATPAAVPHGGEPDVEGATAASRRLLA